MAFIPARSLAADGRHVTRSFGALLTMALGVRRAAWTPPPSIRFRADVPDPGAHAVRTSAGELTPYAAELLADEMRGVRGDRRVELFVESGLAARLGASAQRHIEYLRSHGVEVRISE
jgi:hypothetical protein